MSNSEISTSHAIDILRNLSPNFFREDTVMVQCQNASENARVIELAQEALRNGYVTKVGGDERAGHYDVLVAFRKPPIVE